MNSASDCEILTILATWAGRSGGQRDCPENHTKIWPLQVRRGHIFRERQLWAPGTAYRSGLVVVVMAPTFVTAAIMPVPAAVVLETLVVAAPVAIAVPVVIAAVVVVAVAV